MSTFPSQFLGDIPELQDYRRDMDFLPDGDLARRCGSYHLDSPGAGKPSVAALVGLGGESVCDFFAPIAREMLVIEDTGLACWTSDRRGAGLGADEMVGEFANECRRKAAGSAKILGALYAKFIVAKGGEKNSAQAECEFLVVITDADLAAQWETSDARAFDELVDRATESLQVGNPDGLSPPYVLFDIVSAKRFAINLAGRV